MQPNTTATKRPPRMLMSLRATPAALTPLPAARLPQDRIDKLHPRGAVSVLPHLAPAPADAKAQALLAARAAAAPAAWPFMPTQAPISSIEPGAARQLLEQQFAWHRAHTSTEWELLSIAAFVSPRTLFNLAVRIAAPSWTIPMVKTYLEEDNFERWSLLPDVAHVVARFRPDNACPLAALAEHAKMPRLQTPHQYAVSRAPELDKQFIKLRDAFGSRFYFHGSLLAHWHQIIVQGLEPKSGTAMQLHGAASGQGLYVSHASVLSASFMGTTATRVLGIVEVINHPSIAQDRSACVVPSKALAALRYIAIYKNDSPVPAIDAGDIEPPATYHTAARHLDVR